MIKDIFTIVNEDLVSEDQDERVCAHVFIFVEGLFVIVCGFIIYAFYWLILPIPFIAAAVYLLGRIINSLGSFVFKRHK